MRYSVCTLFLFFAVIASSAQNPPQSTPDQSLEHRGNQGMGFDQQKITHHFLLTKDGGVIQVSANSPDDKTSIDQIRMHLEHIASAFGSGDFDIPMFVHDQTPPGVDAMKRLRKKMFYKVQFTDAGGRVLIGTANPKARQAIWDFLRFQIREHKTGDPL